MEVIERPNNEARERFLRDLEEIRIRLSPEEEEAIRRTLAQRVLFTTVERMSQWVVNWARGNSLFPLTFGLACCAIEQMATGGPRFDMARFGYEVFRPSPRQADLIVIAGTLTKKMAPVVRQLWEQMAQPKWSIAMGACASTGGMYNSFAVVQGADWIIPIDVYVPGCPPRPESLLYGFLKLAAKIRKEKGRVYPWIK
ncbi:MAG: NADH-quinone oxidoreductase subunit B [candidate division WOR-3 bacterium]